ncbi:MAG: DUF2027 domain-containing protein [Bacteroidaceae bacterium]|nr:DUF2027 domain-containing protein [Bacteroidaceae bacterium]
MKIGDTVRFLSEVGGGVVKGFQGKDIVLVEDEDGFDIPMLKSQVVVIDREKENMAGGNVENDVPQEKNVVPAPAKPQARGNLIDAEQFQPKPFAATTRRTAPTGKAEALNVYLSFLPNDVKAVSQTTFECYLVNDSPYFLQVLYLNAEGASWRARFCATVEPDTKLFVEEFDRTVLNDLERLCVQVIAWMPDRPFSLKPALATEIRLDCTKFYKLHTFQPNEFFRDPNWTVPVIRDDRPVRSAFPDAEKMQEALLGKKKADEAPQKPAVPASKPKPKPEIIEVDLHIDELLDTTAGLSSGDMLMAQMNEFRRVMDQNAGRKGCRIVFIHGKGEGVLRKNILQELKHRYKNCTAQDASFREYGFGATLVKVG